MMTNNALSYYESTKQALAHCVKFDEVKGIADKATAMAEYARRAKDTTLCDYAIEIKFYAERRAGEMLAAMEKDKGGRPGKTGPTVGPVSDGQSHAGVVKLPDLGINKNQSWRWQRLAELSDEAAGKVLAERKSHRNSGGSHAPKAKSTSKPTIAFDNNGVVVEAPLSNTAQQKLEAAMRVARKQLEIEITQRIRAESRKFWEDTALPNYNKTYAEYQAVIKGRRGVLNKADFNLIRSCLHPDSRNSVSDEKLAQAFMIFNKLEINLLKEKDSPTSSPPMPTTWEELLASHRRQHDEKKARAKAEKQQATT